MRSNELIEEKSLRSATLLHAQVFSFRSFINRGRQPILCLYFSYLSPIDQAVPSHSPKVGLPTASALRMNGRRRAGVEKGEILEETYYVRSVTQSDYPSLGKVRS